VRFSRCDVRDHMNYRKSDRLHSYRFYRALQRQKSQCATFARFSEPRDFRVFQHNPPISDTIRPLGRQGS
jgi:hypothetical protein